MILPAQLPDETLCSLLARLGRLNGVIDFRDIAAMYLGDAVCPSFIDARIDLPEFCNRTKGAYGSPESVLEKMTWYVAQTRIGERDQGEASAIRQGAETPTLYQLTFDDVTSLGFCPACVEQDIHQFGVAYWHRIHQLLILCSCPHHGCPVTKMKVKRASLHIAFPLPGDFAAQRQPAATIPEYSVPPHEQELALIAQEILADTSEPHDGLCIRATLLDVLRTQRLLNADGGIRLTDLLHRLWQSSATGNRLPPSNERLMVTRVVRGLTSAGNRVAALGRVLLIQCLFGSWMGFREKLHWMEVLGVSDGKYPKQGGPAPNLGELITRHREVCQAFMQAHPNGSRLEFARAEYRSFRWLLHNDKEWLSNSLPIPKRDDAQLTFL